MEHPAEYQEVWVVDQAAWTETVKTTIYCCNGCDAEFSSRDEWKYHDKEKINNADFDHGGYTDRIVKNYIEHEAQGHYEQSLVKEAWTETVTKGYKCECGETK